MLCAFSVSLTASAMRCLILFAALRIACPPIRVPREATVEPPSAIIAVAGSLNITRSSAIPNASAASSDMVVCSPCPFSDTEVEMFTLASAFT